MYRDECERLLGNTRHYKRLSRDPTIDVQEEITFLVSKGKENNWITDHEASYLIQTNPKIPYFYILPKVHKEKIPPPGEKKLPFLDLLIYEQDGGLATEVYYKPTDCNNLLQYQSFHPRALRDNLPVGQFLRLRRNCSSVTDYRKHADKLSTKLHTKDYPPHLVNRARKRARNNNRDQLLQPRAQKPSLDKIVCVTTFNPLSNEIQKIIREN
ncbi:hypothetical protein NDU88_000911 [Pleurodeles waltl]|uniref:Helix-turn-helix domain-containing protein n=1 Tax=Pleurodeles waltl TaxID=8319 RepID=A0AAV7U6C8_PLEWA|nr:hypothetical protein NDU88_000911 [Pleurodeles waltl]